MFGIGKKTQMMYRKKAIAGRFFFGGGRKRDLIGRKLPEAFQSCRDTGMSSV